MSSVPSLPSGGRTSNDRGAILVLTALIMILMLMIAAFATDLGAWYRQGQSQQRSADVGSLNAIKSYDVTMKNYIASKGQTSFSGLTAAQQAEAEQLAFQAAVDAVVESLEIGGTTISSPPVLGPGCCLPKPGFSTVTFNADDGTEITITRNDSNEIVVDITQAGAQYFTSIVRDAPDIIRSSTAVLSNCDADCSRDIELNPPFQGFAAAAQGDGYRPLLGNDQKVYAVNHHAAGSNGSIVCMDALDPDNVARCSGWNPPVSNQYYTHNKADDYIDNTRNRLYFPAYKSNSDDVGIACLETDSTPQWCPFTKLGNWDRSSSYDQDGYIAVNGVWVVGAYPKERMFAMTQDGVMHCIDVKDIGSGNPLCGGYPKNTALVGLSGMRTLSYRGSQMVLGELIDGKIYNYVDRNGSSPFGYFSCWDTSTNATCSGWGGAKGQSTFFDDRERELKFTRHNTAGNPTGWCIAPRTSSKAEFRHHCVSLTTGATMSPIPQLANTFNNWVGDTSTEPSLYGEGFTWEGERLFFGVVDNNPVNVTPQIYCYSWKTQSPCGEFEGEQIYGMVQVSEDCILGVGHSSLMYSFSPKSLTACTGSSVETLVYPCFCNNSTDTRYGTLELPPELVAVLETAEATVIGTDGTVLTQTDILTQPMDLASFNGDPGPLQLEIIVQSKLNGQGDVMWTQPYSASLTLTVQPTLSD